MNTPAHLILGIAAFGKPGRPRVTVAAALGGLAPDLSLYFMTAGALVMGIGPQRIFEVLYFSDAWQAVFAIDNSVFVWGAVVGLGLWLGRRWIVAFGGAALLHIACDLPLHHDDGRPHFWPVSDWVYESPLSYWDTRHGAAWIAPLEAVLVVAVGIWVLTRLRAWWARGLLIAALAVQLGVGGFWGWMFA